MSTDLDLAARWIGSEVGYVKTFTQAYTYRRVRGTSGIILAGGARLGLATGFERSVERLNEDGTPVLDPDGQPIYDTVKDLPASERFFAGGDTTVRGFALDRLGTESTLDSNGFPTGGNALMILNAEVRVPVTRTLGGVVFVDAGNVFAPGVGVRRRRDSCDRGVRRALQIAGRSHPSRRGVQAGSAHLRQRQPRGWLRYPRQHRAGVLMRASWRCAIVFGAAVVAVCPARPAAAQPAPVVLDAIVVTVNGQVITASDVRAATHLFRGQGRAPADRVAALIDRALMLDEVERASPGMLPPDQVEARRREVEASLGAATLAMLATRDAMTEPRLRAWLRDDLRIEAYLTQRFAAAAQPTDEEVASFFATNAPRFTQAGAPADDAAIARARAALVDTRQQGLVDAWLESVRRRADIVVAPR